MLSRCRLSWHRGLQVNVQFAAFVEINKHVSECQELANSLHNLSNKREIYHEREKVVKTEKTKLSFLFPILAFLENISLAYDFKG